MANEDSVCYASLSGGTCGTQSQGVYFLVKDYWGCATGWGHIFTTRLTIMGLHYFLVELLEWGRKLSGFLG